MPALLYGVLWWRDSRAGYTFTELLCVYGYSLAVYIPVSILWVVQVVWLQWLLLIVAMALSGVVLVFTLWPSVKDDKKQIALVSMIVVILLHFLLAAGFLLYFFVPSSTPVSAGTTTVTAGVTTSSTVPTSGTTG